MLDNTQYILGSCNSDTAHIDFFNNLRRFTNKNSCSVIIINHVVKSWPDTILITKQALEKGRTLQQVADLMIFTQRWFVNMGEEDENGVVETFEQEHARLDIAKNRHGGVYKKFELEMVSSLKIKKRKNINKINFLFQNFRNQIDKH